MRPEPLFEQAEAQAPRVGAAADGPPADISSSPLAAATAATCSDDSPRSAPSLHRQDITLRLQIMDGRGAERRTNVVLPSNSVLADLKARHFREEMVRGWQPRCIFQGRLLADGDPLSRLPTDAFVQCFLQRPVSRAAPVVTPAQGEQELVLAWAGLGGLASCLSGRCLVPVCTGVEDLIFHSAFALCLAVAWGLYFADAVSFDILSCAALYFFSASWLFVGYKDHSAHVAGRLERTRGHGLGTGMAMSSAHAEASSHPKQAETCMVSSDVAPAPVSPPSR